MPLHASSLHHPHLPGLLILGASGRGKSSLVWHCIQHFGAHLISDDQTCLLPQPHPAPPLLAPPATIAGKLAWGGQLFSLPYHSHQPLTHVLCLDPSPPPHWIWQEHRFPCLSLPDVLVRISQVSH